MENLSVWVNHIISQIPRERHLFCNVFKGVAHTTCSYRRGKHQTQSPPIACSMSIRLVSLRSAPLSGYRCSNVFGGAVPFFAFYPDAYVYNTARAVNTAKPADERFGSEHLMDLHQVLMEFHKINVDVTIPLFQFKFICVPPSAAFEHVNLKIITPDPPPFIE